MPAKRPHSKHTWTDDDRILLGVMTKFFDISREERATIFNCVIQKSLKKEGLPDGLAVAAVDSQISDIKRTTRGHSFQDIQSMTLTEARKMFHGQKGKIEQAAQALGIALKLRLHLSESQVTSSKRRLVADRSEWSSSSDSDFHGPEKPKAVPVKLKGDNKRRRISKRRESTMETTITAATATTPSITSISSDSCTTCSYETASDSGDEGAIPLDDDDFAATATRLRPRLRLRFNNQGKTSNIKQRPRLLFRAFERGHGLKARKFLLLPGAIPPPPPYPSDEFKKFANSHLSEDKTFDSPFLSFTESPARALEIISKSKKPLSLSAIDYNEVEADMGKRFALGTGIWLVPDICELHELKHLVKIHDETGRSESQNRRNYTGIGEFLAWGSIESGKIAEFNPLEARRLLLFMKRGFDINYESGRAFSLHLSKIKHIYREVVGYKLLRAFKIPGYQRGCSGPDYDNFVAGIYDERPPFESSTTPVSDTHSNDNEEEIPKEKRASIIIEIPRKPDLLPNVNSTLPRVPEFSLEESIENKENVKHDETSTNAATAQTSTTQNKTEVLNLEPNTDDTFVKELLQFAASPTPTSTFQASDDLNSTQGLASSPDSAPSESSFHTAPTSEIATPSATSQALKKGLVGNSKANTSKPVKSNVKHFWLPSTTVNPTKANNGLKNTTERNLRVSSNFKQKAQAPENSKQVNIQRNKTREEIAATTTATTKKHDQSDIRNHFSAVTKKSSLDLRSASTVTASKKSTTDNAAQAFRAAKIEISDDSSGTDNDGDVEDDDDEEVEIIAEAKYKHRRRLRRGAHVKSTTQTQTTSTRTTTVLTLRSRSLGETVAPTTQVQKSGKK